MLKRLYVDNFRCLVNFTISFDRVNVLLGENGSGKTAVFDVLRKLQAFLCKPTGPGIFGADDVTRWQTRGEQTFEIETEVAPKKYVYKLVIAHSPGQTGVASEELFVDGQTVVSVHAGQLTLSGHTYKTGMNFPGSAFPMLARGNGGNPPWIELTAQLQRMVIAGLNPFAMAAESRAEDRGPTDHLENFVAWYRYASQEFQGSVPEFMERLKAALPGFVALKLPSSGEQVKILRATFVNGQNPHDYSFSDLSHGQKILIALYFMVFGLKGAGYSLFLDEPDNFLALREIQPWVAALEKLAGDGLEQAVLISHHPEIIDYLGKSAGRWFSRSDGGPVRTSTIPPETGGLSLSETMARGWNP